MPKSVSVAKYLMIFVCMTFDIREKYVVIKSVCRQKFTHSKLRRY